MHNGLATGYVQAHLPQRGRMVQNAKVVLEPRRETEVIFGWLASQNNFRPHNLGFMPWLFDWAKYKLTKVCIAGDDINSNGIRLLNKNAFSFFESCVNTAQPSRKGFTGGYRLLDSSRPAAALFQTETFTPGYHCVACFSIKMAKI